MSPHFSSPQRLPQPDLKYRPSLQTGLPGCSRWFALACWVFLSAAIGHASARGQGGGNANAVGLSLENATNAAAAAKSGSPVAPSAAPASAPAMDTSSGPPAGYGPPQSSEYSGDPSSGYGEGYSDSYGEGDMGYGGSTASGGNLALRAQVAVMTASQQVSRSIAGFLGATLSDAEFGGRQLTLWEQAALSFYRGDQRRALSLYHAHIVADGDAASDARSAVMYSRLLKRPTWLVRIGLSIHPRVPEEFAGDPQPIREDTRIASANPRMRRGGSEESYSGPSEEFSSDDQSGSMDSQGSDLEGGFDGRPVKPNITTLGGAATEQVKTAVDRQLGLVADVTSELFTALHTAGKFGRALDAMEAKGAALAAMSQQAGDLSPSDLPMWIPGVDYVGEGSYIDMLAKAKASEIDVLMHFDIIVKANRAGPPQYTTRCRLFHVDSGETIVISKAIDKYEIASKPNGNRETILEILKSMFEIVDKKLALEPMPPLQALHAATRVESLLASKNPDSLRNLAEMVMFRSRDLLTPEQLDKAVYFAGGDVALQLIHDEEVSRYERAAAYVDQELTVAAEQ